MEDEKLPDEKNVLTLSQMQMKEKRQADNIGDLIGEKLDDWTGEGCKNL